MLLAVFGFLVFVAQQLIKAGLDAQSATDRAIVDSSRDAIIQEIRGTVNRTADIVTELNHHLGSATIGDLGQQLVTVESAAARALASNLSSVRTRIVRTLDVEKVVKTMIDAQWSECLSDSPSGRFLVSLARVVRAAT